ncbi:MAG: hypothetical protein IPO88_13730 [Nannocystis sp.]|uniref:hypothetical protein n=1 Tax=Nannocystis sp. TaxID=1962667 RepID=UPI0024231977|nr:hypothetical protein [Nannocystis sp.]MBK9754538.1 hypothetical protein [Nannocystis sp.]
MSSLSLRSALAHLRRAKSLRIHNCPSLVDLTSLACLRDVDGVTLYDNPYLVDLSPLAHLERAESINLQRMPIVALPSFTPSYQGFHTLHLHELPELRDLDALHGLPGLLDTAAQYRQFTVDITDAPALESIAGLADPIASAAALASADSAEYLFDVELADLPALNDLDGLEAITSGDLTLRRLPKISDLEPLGALERTSLLELVGLGALPSLAGLDSLTEAHRMTLGGCDDGDAMTALQTLAGADALTEIGSELWIADAPALIDLSAPSLTHVESFVIVDAPALPDLEIAEFTAQVDPTNACTGGLIECGCMGQMPEAAQLGCPAPWSGGSAVAGAGAGAPFDGTTAFFGWSGDGYSYAELVVVLLDATADIEAAKDGGLDDRTSGRPKAVLQTYRDYPYWIGVRDEQVALYSVDDAEGTVQLDVQGRLGNWATLDPADPPRLFGQITSTDPNAPLTLDGPFEAAFCRDFVALFLE